LTEKKGFLKKDAGKGQLVGGRNRLENTETRDKVAGSVGRRQARNPGKVLTGGIGQGALKESGKSRR